MTATQQGRRIAASRNESYLPGPSEQLIWGNGRSTTYICCNQNNCSSAGSVQKAQLVINAPRCWCSTTNGWKSCFVQQQPLVRIKHDRIEHTVRWAPRDLWEQVAHVDPTAANPTVSDYSRRNARRNAIRRVDGKRFYD